MIDGRRILAVVPARGGSKGIPLKNLRKLGGVPLVALAGKVAGECKVIDRAVVSTDNEEIARVAESAGLPAPFRRPEELSGDRIADWDVLNHALEEMERIDNTTYDIVTMLQPTSPGRTKQHIEATLQKLVSGGFDAVWSVSETDSKHHPLKQLSVGEEGRLTYYDPSGAEIVARQQLRPVYHRNGIAYAITRDCIIHQKSIKGSQAGALVVEGNLPNIDTETDFEWAEFLLSRRKQATE
ncbi:MAG: acylneuraminate cytidylyltransferase family protein [Anderseniella sp.]|uniref:acylneuraminate cytidylyltransferase family protein n=1 Tax=Parasphingorhabdus sp. TaxID=2709688 RepID=UPI003280B78B